VAQLSTLGHMKRSLIFASFLLVLTVLLTGCVLTELRVTNHTGGQIQFYTGHTKKVTVVPAVATVVVPHTAGRVIIITQQDEVWEYNAVVVPDYSSELTKGFKKLILPISVEPDGAIMLPSGRKILPSQMLRVKQ
jgi:hypothetical protein